MLQQTTSIALDTLCSFTHLQQLIAHGVHRQGASLLCDGLVAAELAVGLTLLQVRLELTLAAAAALVIIVVVAETQGSLHKMCQHNGVTCHDEQ